MTWQLPLFRASCGPRYRTAVARVMLFVGLGSRCRAGCGRPRKGEHTSWHEL